MNVFQDEFEWLDFRVKNVSKHIGLKREFDNNYSQPPVDF